MSYPPQYSSKGASGLPELRYSIQRQTSCMFPLSIRLCILGRNLRGGLLRRSYSVSLAISRFCSMGSTLDKSYRLNGDLTSTLSPASLSSIFFFVLSTLLLCNNCIGILSICMYRSSTFLSRLIPFFINHHHGPLHY